MVVCTNSTAAISLFGNSPVIQSCKNTGMLYDIPYYVLEYIEYVLMQNNLVNKRPSEYLFDIVKYLVEVEVLIIYLSVL